MCATHLQPAFVDNAYWKGAVGCLGYLGDLFGDGFGDKPSDDVPNDDPSHPTNWFTECCEPADNSPAWTKDRARAALFASSG